MIPPTLTDSERHEIVAVLQELDPSAPAEKRCSARRKVLMELEIQVLQFNSRTIRQSVILANVSRRGVAVLRDRPFTLGARFAVLLEFAEGGATLALCTPRNTRLLSSGLYKIGAQLTTLIEDATSKTPIPADWIEHSR